jgi:pyridoxal 5'-phosphate synthase pdxS subunit
VVNQSFEYLKKLRDFFYGMLELKDRLRERGFT